MSSDYSNFCICEIRHYIAIVSEKAYYYFFFQKNITISTFTNTRTYPCYVIHQVVVVN